MDFTLISDLIDCVRVPSDSIEEKNRQWFQGLSSWDQQNANMFTDSKSGITPFNKRSAAPSPSFTLHARVTGRGPQITSRWLMPPGQLLPLVKLARWLPLYRLPIRNKTKRLLPTFLRRFPAIGVSCLSNRVAIVSPIEFAESSQRTNIFPRSSYSCNGKGTTMPPFLPPKVVAINDSKTAK